MLVLKHSGINDNLEAAFCNSFDLIMICSSLISLTHNKLSLSKKIEKMHSA